MKSKASILSGFFLLSLSFGLSAQPKDIFVNKLTAINPASYTDVVFMGVKDTALVSTFSGRIAVRINGVSTENVITNLNDEIYSLAYNPVKNEIAASTLENGIIVVHQKTGKQLKTLRLKTTWSVNILYSDDFAYLFTQDQKGNRYIWDVNKGYKEVTISSKLPQGRMVKLDKDGLLTIVSPKKAIVWDVKNDKVASEASVSIIRFGDMDSEGNYLSVDFNECSKYNSINGKTEFTVKHPDWLRNVKDYPNYSNMLKANPADYTKDGLLIMKDYHMQLTMVRFAQDKIYTASIDRSIRVWDKKNGSLITSLTGHNATINKIKVNVSETQLVSIDLKGEIRFWDL
jgi:WD40 repeat protein